MKDNQHKFTRMLGYVAKSHDGSGQTFIFCPEARPTVTVPSADPEIFTFVCRNDVGGEDKTVRVSSSDCILADYLSIGSSSESIPDVVPAERVMVLQFSNGDYYWFTLTPHDNTLRKTEHWKVLAMDDVVRIKEVGTHNTYEISMNTKEGARGILLRTCKGTDEAYEYEIAADAEASQIRLNDKDGKNGFTLDSKTPAITMQNRDGSYVDINKKIIRAHAPDKIHLTAGNQFILEAPTQSFIGKVASFTLGDAISFLTKSAVTVASCIGLNGSVKADGPLIATIMRSGGYSLGPLPKGYDPATTNPSSGSSSAPNNTPDNGAPIGAYRHVAAWEDVFAAFKKVATAIIALSNKEYTPSPDTSGFVADAQSAKMENTKGEP